LRRSRLSFVAAVAMASTAALVAVPSAAQAAPKGPKNVAVQLLAMNDFHGRISLTSGGDSELLTAPGPDGVYGDPDPDDDEPADDIVQTVGGAANVASTVARQQADFKRSTHGPSGSFFVAAGDLISASPFESSIFKDEPTIEVLNAMGLDVSSVGNHEFDRGTQELRRISGATDGQYSDDVTACEGVTPGVDGCYTDSRGRAFHGTDFPYLAANVISRSTGEPMLPPYQVFQTPAHQKFALIGVVTQETPGIVSPAGIADVEFIDEAKAVNEWVPVLQRQGIEAIGVLIHEGGGVDPAMPPPAYDGCENLDGPITTINENIDDAVDLIISGHSHQAYNCLLPVPGGHQRLVTQAGYYGRLVTDIRLSLDRRTGDVDRSATYDATNVPVTREHPDRKIQQIVDFWTERSAEAGNEVIGSITADITRAYTNGVEDRQKESSLGNLVADAQLWALQQDPQFNDPVVGAPVIAFMNPGGLRADLLYASSDAGEGDGNVTFREAFNVQPFGNTVNAITLTGAQIKQVLEEQFQPRGQRSQLILGTNEGFTYSYDLSQAFGERVDPASIMLGTEPIDPLASYRVVANSFLTAGGDQFTTLGQGDQVVTGPVDSDALVAYFEANSPVSPPPANHSTQL
jgi:5'-nucleotidase